MPCSCEVCDLFLGSPELQEEHLESEDHCNRAQEQHRKDNEEGLHCETCDVHATSRDQLGVHLEGSKHKRHVAQAALNNPSEVSSVLPEAVMPMTHSPTYLNLDKVQL